MNPIGQLWTIAAAKSFAISGDGPIWLHLGVGQLSSDHHGSEVDSHDSGSDNDDDENEKEEEEEELPSGPCVLPRGSSPQYLPLYCPEPRTPKSVVVSLSP